MERIIKNKNSYITIEEADEIIAKTYSDDDTLANYWLCSEDDDKAGYLLLSMDEIESCMFQGRKYLYNQVLQFPRTKSHDYCYYWSRGLFRYKEDEVPFEVKKAQAINALSLLDKDISGEGIKNGKHLTSYRAERELNAWLNGTYSCV